MRNVDLIFSTEKKVISSLSTYITYENKHIVHCRYDIGVTYETYFTLNVLICFNNICSAYTSKFNSWGYEVMGAFNCFYTRSSNSILCIFDCSGGIRQSGARAN